jgi:hypothetical protein
MEGETLAAAAVCYLCGGRPIVGRVHCGEGPVCAECGKCAECNRGPEAGALITWRTWSLVSKFIAHAECVGDCWECRGAEQHSRLVEVEPGRRCCRDCFMHCDGCGRPSVVNKRPVQYARAYARNGRTVHWTDHVRLCDACFVCERCREPPPRAAVFWDETVARNAWYHYWFDDETRAFHHSCDAHCPLEIRYLNVFDRTDAVWNHNQRRLFSEAALRREVVAMPDLSSLSLAPSADEAFSALSVKDAAACCKPASHHSACRCSHTDRVVSTAAQIVGACACRVASAVSRDETPLCANTDDHEVYCACAATNIPVARW